MVTFTLQQLKDAIGDPITLLTVYNPKTDKYITFTDSDLPPAVVTAIVAFVNAHFGG